MACGTGSPIWINGTYPVSVGETVNSTACVRGFKQTDTCIATYHIEIKKCSGFYVYKLPYVDLCYSAFCFGNHTCERKVTTDKKESE
ncbi:oncoprotein-induced transcript 3 protein-like [Mytilus galloprovincialis]|uniref:oncoprotein-induced transcript 3 protein-like n=1 Tax=Mytilus galloprovincialis TaxID=29158 RepID=UPI003F7BE7BE